ncbi:FecR family protein [Paraflavitalea pollutisoli]|uniref:FecR family protein n=1 Tax=Paraflavitalea pollutisoli TaxID=3034143 RepID=UPI0023EDBC0F|nr:FecR family protein [Paraflavitalea sp. H1-2-19X]
METTITDALLTRFLTNDLSAAEQEMVQQWMAANDENRRYFLEIQQAWQLAGMKEVLDHALDEINVEERWASFRQSVASDEPVTAEELGCSQYVELDNVRSRNRYRVPAIAATVLVVLGLGWWLLRNDTGNSVAEMQEPEREILYTVQHAVNNTGKDKIILLPDSSIITLSDSSEITYRTPFVHRRDITLVGKARFKVTHDTSRPFTVFSKEISTTDLGTEFTVTAWKAGRLVSVRLYEGAIVIRPNNATRTPMKKEVFLVPGQEFVFDGTARVSWFRKKQLLAVPDQDNRSEEDPLIPDDAGNTWYMFNNQPLDQVLNQLSALYAVKIVYNKRDVRNSYFTAKYRSTDSLGTILDRIARLNKLTVTLDDNGYKLTK